MNSKSRQKSIKIIQSSKDAQLRNVRYRFSLPSSPIRTYRFRERKQSIPLNNAKIYNKEFPKLKPKKLSPAIFNNIFAVSNVKRKVSLKKDIVKPIHFGTLTILKSIDTHSRYLGRGKIRNIEHYVDTLKMKWDTIRRLIYRFPRIAILLDRTYKKHNRST